MPELLRDELVDLFGRLAREEGRAGTVGVAADVTGVRLRPEQAQYLAGLLQPLRGELTAISLALAYDPSELEGIPAGWGLKAGRDALGGGALDRDAWNRYARAYGRLNEAVTRVAARLAGVLGGVAEGATLEGRAGKVKHVSEYYPHCVSHRAFAAAAGLGWIGKHGLLVTPEFGPAVRLATVFVPGAVKGARPDDECEGRGCADCAACLDACPILKRAARQDDPDLYREGCLRRIRGLRLEADVCGICVRACYEAVRSRRLESR